METKFQPTNETPLAALTIGQFKDLLGEMVLPQPATQSQQESFPGTFGKNECSKLTGYAVNTINKMVSEKTIPFYKRNAKSFSVETRLKHGYWLTGYKLSKNLLKKRRINFLTERVTNEF